jgi:hypothetical protein
MRGEIFIVVAEADPCGDRRMWIVAAGSEQYAGRLASKLNDVVSRYVLRRRGGETAAFTLTEMSNLEQDLRCSGDQDAVLHLLHSIDVKYKVCSCLVGGEEEDDSE